MTRHAVAQPLGKLQNLAMNESDEKRDRRVALLVAAYLLLVAIIGPVVLFLSETNDERTAPAQEFLLTPEE